MSNNKTFREYLQIILKQENPLKFLLSRLIKTTGLWRFLKIRLNGYSLWLHPSALSLSLWMNPQDRSEDIEVIKMILKSGDHFCDVGANIGQLSIEAALIVGSTGRITSYEAHPRTASFFSANVKLNKLNNIRLVQSAVGAECGWVSFTDQNSDDQNKVSDIGSIDVPVLTLDTLFDEEKIDLLKIDIEGYELFALQGSLRTLHKVDFIYFEAWDLHFSKYGYYFSDLYELLASNGFFVGKIEGDKVHLLKNSDSVPDCINLISWKDSDYLNFRTGLKVIGES